RKVSELVRTTGCPMGEIMPHQIATIAEVRPQPSCEVLSFPMSLSYTIQCARHAMVIKKAPDVSPSEITPRTLYLNRREWMTCAGGVVAALVAPIAGSPLIAATGAPLAIAKRMSTTTDPPSSLETVTTFNNFYEFGTDKSDPARNSGRFQ